MAIPSDIRYYEEARRRAVMERMYGQQRHDYIDPVFTEGLASAINNSFAREDKKDDKKLLLLEDI